MNTFNLEDALDGSMKVVSDGVPVTQLTLFTLPNGHKRLFGVRGDDIKEWFLDGRFYPGETSPYDLVPQPEIVGRWVNLYHGERPGKLVYAAYPTMEAADFASRARPARINGRAIYMELESAFLG